ncbi:MAG: prepilin-type N-terminal cleavage/methylation domain-containing protein [candidate division Zixibacteria bacterium]|nr:prepilin-type N-terminal cleavage/methylation domain-containing protein [candidate division Zixibacteria bacterium]
MKSLSAQYAGFTLVELVIVIVVLAIIAAVGIPQIGGMIQISKTNATKTEMVELKKAIIGNPQTVAGGVYVSCGFEGDIGFAPSRLEDLVTKPDSISLWDRLTRRGWNGPYIDSIDGGYLADEWESAYVYNGSARTLTSNGSGTGIVVGF